MVAINVIPEQDSMLPAWIERGDYTFPVLVGASTEKVFEDYRMTAAPLNFLLDSQGKILARYEGYSPGQEKEIEARIAQEIAS